MPRALRRGFKAECERISMAFRAELGLTVAGCFNAIALASHLGIPIASLPDLKKFGASQDSISRLLSEDAGFSAITVCAGTSRIIVYNPRQPTGRRANSLAHELSHIILEHPASPALGFGGCRRWDSELEAEADWLAGALLVPRAGALLWLENGGNLREGASHFGVSQALFRWRVSQTGVIRQFQALSKLRGA